MGLGPHALLPYNMFWLFKSPNLLWNLNIWIISQTAETIFQNCNRNKSLGQIKFILLNEQGWQSMLPPPNIFKVINKDLVWKSVISPQNFESLMCPPPQSKSQNESANTFIFPALIPLSCECNDNFSLYCKHRKWKTLMNFQQFYQLLRIV